MSFEAAIGKAPGDRPHSEAASGVVAASEAVAESSAVVVVAYRPFAALRTGTAATLPLLPPLVVSARNLSETKHKACRRIRSAMAWSVQLSSAIMQGGSAH